jgi:DNA-binding response OmpR family regulator
MEQTVSALRTGTTVAATSNLAPTTEQVLHAGDLAVDRKRRMVFWGKQPLELSPTEYNVLAHLVQNADRVITCSEPVRESLDYECTEQEARPVIRVHIHRLRQKIEEDVTHPKRLVTVRAAGYMLVTGTPDAPGGEQEKA